MRCNWSPNKIFKTHTWTTWQWEDANMINIRHCINCQYTQFK